MNKKITLSLMIIVAIATGQITAQTLISGKVMNAISGYPISNANVSLVENREGTSTDLTGEFTLKVKAGEYTIKISSVGFVTVFNKVTVLDEGITNAGIIVLYPDVIALDEVNVISSVAVERKTPVALTSIPSKRIETQLGDQTFPEIMKMVPGVYPTRSGGGSGDAEVNVRGFEQENVALLLNGIPISSVENGLVYWNNWIGLSDATRSVQVQRGLGASNVALNSVGGTINIVTKTTESEKGGSIGYSVSSYGNSKLSLALSTGKLKNGVAVNFLGSRTEEAV